MYSRIRMKGISKDMPEIHRYIPVIQKMMKLQPVKSGAMSGIQLCTCSTQKMESVKTWGENEIRESLSNCVVVWIDYNRRDRSEYQVACELYV